MEQILKPGDTCPCCGQPILSDDPGKLLLLSYLAWLKRGNPRP